MRKLLIYINIVMGILFGSCNSSPIPSPQVAPVIGEIISRDAIANTSIKEGSQALFHATGGATIDNQIFTFKNGIWQNDNGEGIRIDSSVETKLTALYPANNGSILNNPYNNDTLQDVLIAQSTFKDQTNIQLNFRHLFSRLTVHIHSSIAEEIEAVKIAVPQIESIDPISGELKFLEQLHTTQFAKGETSVYSCIVPSHPNCPVELTFIFKFDKEVTHSLTHTFVSGHKYECHVNRQPGIRNADDLIAFAELINKEHTGNRNLSEFGEEIEGKMVYRLLNNITLTEENCSNLLPIGKDTFTPFNDTFDGEGHTISNLHIKSYNNYGGLFGHVLSGHIKNLHINNASSTLSPNCILLGVIASYNNGIIDNCSVTNSTLNSSEDGYIGAICFQSNGVIINCYSKNNTFNIKKRVYAGGIVANAESKIHNCYSFDNRYQIQGSGYMIGSIAGTSTTVSTLNIRNCYTYHTQNTSRWGSAVGNANKVSIKNFYYNKGSLFYLEDDPNTITDTNQYNDEFKKNSTHIVSLLNDWIETTGKKDYKEYTYNRWTTASDGSPCFE